MAVEMRLESPSDDLLKLISNDSPTDLPHSWSSQTGGSLWEGRELFSVNGHSGAVRNGCANGNGGAQSPHESRDAKLVPSAAPAPAQAPATCANCNKPTAAPPLPGGKPSAPLPPSLSALTSNVPQQPPPPPPRPPHHQQVQHVVGIHQASSQVHLAPKRCNGGAGISAAAMRHNPHQPQHHPNHPPHNPHQQQQVNPMLQQQMLMHAQQQAKDAMAKVSLLQSTLQQQQKLLQGHEEENMQLQKALQVSTSEHSSLCAICLQHEPPLTLDGGHFQT